MYGYLENATLRRAPNPKVIGENRVWNPTGEMYEAAGYKKVVFTDPPETEPGYHAEDWWKETPKQIRQQWTIVEDPPDISDEEALAIILGGESG
jgi:hypothetical protein